MLARYMLSSCVSPSVPTSRPYCTKTAKRHITHTTPLILFFCCRKSWQNSIGVTPVGGANRSGVGSDRRYSTNRGLSRYTSQERRIIGTWLLWNANRISYALCRVALFPVTPNYLTPPIFEIYIDIDIYIGR